MTYLQTSAYQHAGNAILVRKSSQSQSRTPSTSAPAAKYLASHAELPVALPFPSQSSQLSYRWREPQRGEVIVFRFPLQPSQFFIKRVVGLPGERVRIVDGQVIIQSEEYPQGVVLDEADYLSETSRTGGQTDLQLGAGEYFVLGDNRPASSDSRSWGALDETEVIGRVWIRAWPVGRFGVFDFEVPGFLALPL